MFEYSPFQRYISCMPCFAAVFALSDIYTVITVCTCGATFKSVFCFLSVARPKRAPRTWFLIPAFCATMDSNLERCLCQSARFIYAYEKFHINLRLSWLILIWQFLSFPYVLNSGSAKTTLRYFYVCGQNRTFHPWLTSINDQPACMVHFVGCEKQCRQPCNLLGLLPSYE